MADRATFVTYKLESDGHRQVDMVYATQAEANSGRRRQQSTSLPRLGAM